MDYGDYYWGVYRDYYRDPFPDKFSCPCSGWRLPGTYLNPHSLLSTRQKNAIIRVGVSAPLIL